MYLAGVKPRKILTALKQRDPSNKTVLRTIYNERVKMQLKELQGGTQMQFLYKCITDSGYVSFNKVAKDSGNLECLFFAHPISKQLTKMFPTVFIMDCTYKTNRFRMPLLCIVGVTSTNQTFYSAFAFISNETQSSYVWALDCFRSFFNEHSLPQVIVTDREIALMNVVAVLFPKAKNILCKVHISRNILAKCKKISKVVRNGKIFCLYGNILWMRTHIKNLNIVLTLC
ncbi:hypothetical protein KSP39_PZI016804 [Platanthera zijinensis]|uniref:MULE transposase domain-containing protein n=1 Tax=Platanthera zijinensis TaxID=2320716 RepID=A0AAP0G0K9_9ASPA